MQGPTWDGRNIDVGLMTTRHIYAVAIGVPSLPRFPGNARHRIIRRTVTSRIFARDTGTPVQ